ncbi:SET domain-containing protein 4 [Podila humilis]|nr:SET domain-containing protein 4 [Podila humilis]
MLTPSSSVETLSNGILPPLKRRKPDSALNSMSTSLPRTHSSQPLSPPSPQRKSRGRRGKTARARSQKRKLAEEGTAGQRVDSLIIKDQQYLDFLQWLKDMGCPKTKLTLAEFSNTGRGMMATKNIKAGEVIVQVPERNLVTLKSLQSIYGPRIARFGKNVNSHMIIALHIALLVQAPEKSGWLPYLRLLPKKFDTMPVRYPQELFDLLPENAKAHVNKQKAKIVSDYNCVLDFLKVMKSQSVVMYQQVSTLTLTANRVRAHRPTKTFSQDLYNMRINTRCIYLDAKKQSAADNIALAPMLDFLNHTHDAKTEGRFCTKTKSYEIKTLLPYKKGEQVFINYGPHDNCFILVEYGFVTPDNPYNYVTVDNDFMHLSFPGESAVAKKDKMELLDMAGYYGNDVSFRLLVGLRLRLINPFNKLSASTQHDIAQWQNVINGEVDQISTENERLVPVYLEHLCDEILVTAKKTLGILARHKTTFPVMHLQQLWIETRDIVLSIQDKIHNKEQL